MLRSPLGLLGLLSLPAPVLDVVSEQAPSIHGERGREVGGFEGGERLVVGGHST